MMDNISELRFSISSPKCAVGAEVATSVSVVTYLTTVAVFAAATLPGIAVGVAMGTTLTTSACCLGVALFMAHAMVSGIRMRSAAARSAPSDVVVRLMPDHLVYVRGSVSLIGYAHLHGATIKGDQVLLSASRGQVLTIPLSAFTTRSEAKDFVATIRDRIRTCAPPTLDQNKQFILAATQARPREEDCVEIKNSTRMIVDVATLTVPEPQESAEQHGDRAALDVEPPRPAPQPMVLWTFYMTIICGIWALDWIYDLRGMVAQQMNNLASVAWCGVSGVAFLALFLCVIRRLAWIRNYLLCSIFYPQFVGRNVSAISPEGVTVWTARAAEHMPWIHISRVVDHAGYIAFLHASQAWRAIPKSAFETTGQATRFLERAIQFRSDATQGHESAPSIDALESENPYRSPTCV